MMKKCKHKKHFPLWIDVTTGVVFYRCPDCQHVGRRQLTRVDKLIIDTPFNTEE